MTEENKDIKNEDTAKVEEVKEGAAQADTVVEEVKETAQAETATEAAAEKEQVPAESKKDTVNYDSLSRRLAETAKSGKVSP